MSLTGKTVADTYKDLLTVNSTENNQGLETTLKDVIDGEGVTSAIQLSTTTLKIPAGKTLEIAGTLNSVNATLTGDLSVGDDLTVTDLISGASMVLTGSMTSDSAVIGGGFGSTGLTISNTGVVQTNGGISSDGRISCDNLVIGGGHGNNGLSIDANGRIDTDEIIVAQAVKTTTGVLSSSASNSPKLKLDTATQVSLTVVSGSTDKEILKVKNDGETTIKDTSEDIKFTVKNDGRVGFKGKTTSQLNAISASTGDMAFDSTIGAFKIWRP